MDRYHGKRGFGRTEYIDPDKDEPSNREKAMKLVKSWSKRELVSRVMFKASAAQIDAWAEEYDSSTR